MQKIFAIPFFTLALGGFIAASLPLKSLRAAEQHDNSAKIEALLKKNNLTPINPSQIISKPTKPGSKIQTIPKTMLTLAQDNAGNIYSLVYFYNNTNYDETLKVNPRGNYRSQQISDNNIVSAGGSGIIYTIGSKQIDYEVTAKDGSGHGCDYSVDIYHFAQNGVDYYVPSYITTAIQGNDGRQPNCTMSSNDGSEQNVFTKTFYQANASAAAYFP